MKKLAFAGLFTLALNAACASSLDGTYADAASLARYTFTDDGKVVVSAMGMEGEMTYQMEGDKVTIQTPQGTLVLSMLADGSVRGPMGMQLTKRDK